MVKAMFIYNLLKLDYLLILELHLHPNYTKNAISINKQDGVVPLIGDCFQCNSTNWQESPIQQNGCYF